MKKENNISTESRMTKTLSAGRRKHHKNAARPVLLMRSELDRRTVSARYFEKLVTAIENDLAGPDELSSIEKVLVEAYAGAAVTLQHLNSLLALGEPINIADHSSCVGALVRVASRLGIDRRPKDVTPSLATYLASTNQDEA